MAKNDKNQRRANSLITKLSDTVQNSLDNLYSKTYYSQPSNKQDLDSIKNKLDSSIDNIVSVNMSNTGKGTMSTLYSRMQQNAPKFGGPNDENGKKLEELINDNQVIESGLMGFINNTTTVFDYDNKIDTILKYMPRLQEALDTRKDNVLSADHFSKDFINITSSNISNDSETYNEHIKFVKDTYKCQDLTDEIYDTASKYGEAFVYIVPYKKAVARLLRHKNNIRADLNIKEGSILTESGDVLSMDKMPDGITKDSFQELGLNNIELECSTGCINSVVENVMKLLTFIDVDEKNVVAYTIDSPKEKILVVYNAGKKDIDFKLPDDKEWNVYVNSENAGIKVLYTIKNQTQISKVSCLVAVRISE